MLTVHCWYLLTPLLFPSICMPSLHCLAGTTVNDALLKALETNNSHLVEFNGLLQALETNNSHLAQLKGGPMLSCAVRELVAVICDKTRLVPA